MCKSEINLEKPWWFSICLENSIYNGHFFSLPANPESACQFCYGSNTNHFFIPLEKMRDLGNYNLDRKSPFGFGQAKIKTEIPLVTCATAPLARCGESFHLFSLDRQILLPRSLAHFCNLPRREITLCLQLCFVAPNDNSLYRHTLKQTNY